MIQRMIKKTGFTQLVNAVLQDDKVFYGPVYADACITLSQLDRTGRDNVYL